MAKKTLTTLQTIAERLHLSVSTVSRVLNGKSNQYRISSRTQQAVRDMACQLDFKPNQLARSLRLRKTQTLGLVIPDISNPFFAQIARSVEIEARRHRYSIILCDTQESTELEIESVRLLRSREVEGLILLPVGQQSKHLTNLQTEDFPVVIVDRFLPDLDLPYVASNNYRGAYDAVCYLVNHSHTKIACLQGLPGTSPNERRVRGYLDALQAHNIAPDLDLIRGDSYGSQTGYDQTRQLLSEKVSVTALFALSNLIALGAIRALVELNLRIGEDISILCFDDQPYLAYMDPPITTVDQQNTEMGRLAVRLLFEQLADETIEKKNVLLPTKFIERKSVKNLCLERRNKCTPKH
ncbi:MAG: LacI family DNA-binding transcriptional regulator [Sedimentisphaerales bacterium]|nr:LacI family DNA-binding transcriptional regulator [Sedimentisphaerales bacterium]